MKPIFSQDQIDELFTPELNFKDEDDFKKEVKHVKKSDEKYQSKIDE